MKFQMISTILGIHSLRTDHNNRKNVANLWFDCNTYRTKWMLSPRFVLIFGIWTSILVSSCFCSSSDPRGETSPRRGGESPSDPRPVFGFSKISSENVKKRSERTIVRIIRGHVAKQITLLVFTSLIVRIVWTTGVCRSYSFGRLWIVRILDFVFSKNNENVQKKNQETVNLFPTKLENHSNIGKLYLL